MNQTSVSDRLQNAYSGAVFDVLRSMGYHRQALPYTINPLHISQKLSGPVYTVEGRRDDSLDDHETLLRWCRLLSNAPAGHVIVCQPNDSTVSHMGELSSETLMYRGVKGYIVDGGCRDSAFVEKMGFPVFCRYYTPVDIVGKWAAHSFGEPITIGDVVVHTGDHVMADRDGIVVIPKAILEEVVDRVEEVLQTENKVRTAILRGVDPVDAYLEFGKF
ncbi:MAG TPA: RraA family protein [Chitinophagaceae bacterium]